MKRILIKMINEKMKHLKNKVIFFGEVYGKQKMEIFVDSDIFVLPSRYEIFGIVILEAYACGVPVIASNIPGLKEIVIDKKTGILFEKENEYDLAEKIKMLIKNSSLRIWISKNAKKYVSSNFSIRRNILSLINVYRKITESKK